MPASSPSPRSIDRLVADLAALGVAPGDVVMVHASLRAVGPTEGRAGGLVAALDRAVGPDGTLLMMIGAADRWAWVNERPESERAGLLAGAEPFDTRTTPAQEDIGALAEVFRRHPGTLVDGHPEGRFAARGRRAGELVANPPWDDFYGPGSALDRLVTSGGKVLRLGADLDTVTLIHYAEYLAPLPGKRRVRRHRLVAGPQGEPPLVRAIESLDDEHGIFDLPGEDYFARILRDYLAAGRAHVGTVGGATSELLDAADLVTFAVNWLTTAARAHPEPFERLRRGWREVDGNSGDDREIS